MGANIGQAASTDDGEAPKAAAVERVASLGNCLYVGPPTGESLVGN